MRPSASERPDSNPDEDFPEGGYRVAADVVRRAELEEEVALLKERLHSYEREVFAARRSLRTRRALSIGGLGTTLGVALTAGLAVTGVVTSVDIAVGIPIVAFLIGAVGGMRWEEPNDKFPSASPTHATPPERY